MCDFRPCTLTGVLRGTSWGGFPFPGVYTRYVICDIGIRLTRLHLRRIYPSYDYGSSIRENRALTDKFDEVKRQGLFIRSSPQFLKTDWMGNSSVGIPGVALDGSAAFVTSLRNPDSGTWFHVARQGDSTSTCVSLPLPLPLPLPLLFFFLPLFELHKLGADGGPVDPRANISFSLTVPTSQGPLTLPQTTGSIALDGRQSKLVITDYAFGARGALLYTTASVFFAGTIGARDVLFLYGSPEQSHEFAFALEGTGTRSSSSRVRFVPPFSGSASGNYTTVAVLPQSSTESDSETDAGGLLTIWDSDAQLVLFADPATAATF